MHIKMACAFALMLLCVPAVIAQTPLSGVFRRQADEPAPPRLISPVTEKFPLNNSSVLEFHWENSAIEVRFFEFRLYRGYDLYAKNLMLKENIPGSRSVFSLPAATFEAGQTYSWSLVRVNLDGRKSERSWAAFTVKKGGGHG